MIYSKGVLTLQQYIVSEISVNSLGFCSPSNEKVSHRGSFIVGRSSFLQNAAEIRRKGYFCLARPSQKGQIGHYKSHYSRKPIHALLSRPLRSIGLASLNELNIQNYSEDADDPQNVGLT